MVSLLKIKGKYVIIDVKERKLYEKIKGFYSY